MKKKKLEGAEG